MKILLFNWKDMKHPWAGGAELNAYKTAKGLIKLGHEVTWFTGGADGLGKYDVYDGIKIVRRGSRYTVYIWAFLYYLFKFKGKYDFIIDVENGVPFFTPLFSFKPKICIVHHVHLDVFKKELPFGIHFVPYVLEKYFMPLFYRNVEFVAVSDVTKREMVERLKIPFSKITVIHNGQDTTKFKPPKKFDDKKIILYFGRIMDYKRVDLLVKVFKKVLVEVSNASLHIAGSGPGLDRVKQVAKNLNVPVKFYGFYPEEKKPGLFRKATVFVNPSSREGWGLTVIEANASGVPSIAFKVPGLTEAIRDNETGFLVEDGNLDLAVDKIVEVLNNKKLRRKLSKNSVKWASGFTWENTTRKTHDLMLKVLKK